MGSSVEGWEEAGEADGLDKEDGAFPAILARRFLSVMRSSDSLRRRFIRRSGTSLNESFYGVESRSG
jgi:hypothetical protein